MLKDPPTWLGGDSLNVRRNRPTIFTPGTIVQSLSPRQRAYFVTGRYDGNNWGAQGLCSAGASLGRANAELVKLNAPVLLLSAPKLLPLARRGALH